MGGQALGGFIAWRRHERAVASAAEVKRRHESRLMKMRGVVGVGIGEKDGKEIIRIYVQKESPKILADLPQSLDSIPAKIVAAGRCQASRRSSIGDRPGGGPRR